MFKFENGIDAASVARVNAMHDGKTIRSINTVTMADGRVFYRKESVVNNTIGNHMVRLATANGRIFNVNLCNGVAYDTTLTDKEA